jgi:hypothetical protein
MTQDRKIAGMTVQQIGILVGLGIFACLLFGLTGFLALRRGFSGLVPQASVPASTVPPTATIIVSPTLSLTETPTPIPYDQLIPSGWTQHKTALVEIWLPSNFKDASSGISSGAPGNPSFLELGLALSSKLSTYPVTVSVAYEPLTSNNLEEFIETKLSKVPAQINVAERRKVSVNSTDAYRLMFEGHGKNNISTDDLLFVLQDGSVVWYVRYSAEITDFYEMLPVFEQSVKTFRIVR